MAALRACADLAASARVLAQEAGKVSGAANAGVFLLDYSRRHLVCVASWPTTSERRPIPVTLLHDPLCFCLRSGQAYKADMLPNPEECPSLVQLGVATSSVGAIPLLAPGNVAIGGVLLCFAGTGQGISQVLTLCDYGAAVLSAAMQAERGADLVHMLEEDLTRLKTLTEQEQQLTRMRIIGQSQVIHAVREQILKAAAGDVPVLITGETGTGKELTADAVHVSGKRRDKTLLKINCSALPAPLLESELFGHKKGAFTGATSDHIGLFRSADGGTVLLDEIGDMHVDLQAKLLRFLQEHEVRPVGDVHCYPANVRILASSNKDMEQAMRAGSFRPDLYHRLAVFHIQLPPLRERREDIPQLALHFLENACAAHGRGPLSFAPETFFALCEAPYRGNVRELAACVERAVLMADEQTKVLRPEMVFPERVRTRETGLAQHLELYEANLLAGALERHSGHITNTAKELGLPRRTLSSKLKKYSLNSRGSSCKE